MPASDAMHGILIQSWLFKRICNNYTELCCIMQPSMQVPHTRLRHAAE
jgi:hypothetical protein